MVRQDVSFGVPFSATYTIYSSNTTYILLDDTTAARLGAAEADLSPLDEPYATAP
jgi:hypothetical protein